MRTCGTERVISPAPFPRGVAGCPRSKGTVGVETTAPARGKAFPDIQCLAAADTGTRASREELPTWLDPGQGTQNCANSLMDYKFGGYIHVG